MIQSYDDYKYYLEADRLSMGEKRVRPQLIGQDVWKFQRLLRKLEYYQNCKRSILYKPIKQILTIKFHILSVRLGFSIPTNVFGPGLNIAHRGTIIVNGFSKIGKNCRVHACVNIGTKGGYTNIAPTIGDNVYILHSRPLITRSAGLPPGHGTAALAHPVSHPPEVLFPGIQSIQ